MQKQLCRLDLHSYLLPKVHIALCQQAFGLSAGEKKKINLYYVQETYQQWGQGKASYSLDGAAVWLPGNVLLEIQMIPPSTRGSKADSEEGMQEEQGRGLLITFSWAVNKSTVIGELTLDS